MQPTLFESAEGRLESFLDFHKRNPRVFELFLAMAREAKERGATIGARCIWETIRWNTNVADKPANDEFVLNNNHVPYYSRIVMLKDPELEGYFDRRDKRFDTDDATLLYEFNRVEV